MNILQTFRIAIRAIRRNTMRSFLTTLGIIIGVSAVIGMVVIGEGAKAVVQQTFNSMGSNMLIVMSGTSTAGGVQGPSGSQPSLTWEDLRAIKQEANAVQWVTPSFRAVTQVINEDRNWSTKVMGVGPEYFNIRNWGASPGETFDQSDLDTGRKVVVLGHTVSEMVFGPNSNPVGQTVRIKMIPFQVIGVLEEKGQSPLGEDFDDIVLMPYSSFLSKIQGGLGQYINGVIVMSAITVDDIKRAEKQVTALLRDRHRVAEGADADFTIRNLKEMAKATESGTNTLALLMASIAAVSLLVGGIGIMNIMLVSVTERTREIGLRMAVGAKPRDILAQFLVEALTLSIAGGIMGTIIGLTAADQLAARFHWPFMIRPDIIVIAVGFSAAVGVIFGLYPARKASLLDPIDALRYE